MAKPSSYPSPPHSPLLEDISDDDDTAFFPSTSDRAPPPLRSNSNSNNPRERRDSSAATSSKGRGMSATRPPPGLRKRSSGSGVGSSSRRRSSSEVMPERVAMAPPKDPHLFDTEEEWRTHHEQEKTSGLHHLPLILVALPPLGAIVHGRAENWTDGIILILVCYYLYNLIKIPWEIYYASHSRYVLEGSTPKSGEEESFDDPIAMHRRSHAVSALRRTELLSLLMTMVVPILGSCLLYYVRGILSDPDRYINKFVISLFALATAIKPLLHFAKLVKQNSLYYQSAVWYPSTEVHVLRRRLESLEKDLSQLTRAFATKDDVRILRDGVDIPLTQLSKAVRRFDKKEEYLRLSAEERFALLDAKMEEAAKELATNAELIDRMREEQEQASHPVTTVLRFFFSHVLRGRGQNQDGAARNAISWYQKGVLWYMFFPVNVSALAIDWVATKAEGEDQPEDHKPHGRGVVKIK